MKRGLKKVAQTAPIGNENETMMQLEMNEDMNNQKSTREQSSLKPSSTLEETQLAATQLHEEEKQVSIL